MAMWLVFVATISAWTGWAMWKIGRRFALGSAVALSLLVPTWVKISVGPFPIDVHLGVVIFALAAYCVHPRTRWRGPIVVADCFWAAILTVHVVSDVVNDELSWSIPLRAYGEWGLAYVAGRLAIQELADLKRLLPVMCGVAIVLACWSLEEAVSRVNPADYVVGQRPAESDTPFLLRWGLKRAEGPTQHPIYFGMLQLLLFPWSLQATAVAASGWRSRALRALPWLAGLSILSTMSRGPALALAISLYLTLVVRRPAWRPWLLGGGAIAVVLLAVGWHTTVNTLSTVSEEYKHPQPNILLDGQSVEYSATWHRYYLWRVYAKSMRRAGALGFGTERTNSFPVHVPFGPQDPITLHALRFIDNEFILLDLRFGWLGVAAFVGLIITAAVYAWRLSGQRHPETDLFCASLAATLLAALLAMLTVWMPHDFGFLLLWSAGIAAGAWSGELRGMSSVLRGSRSGRRAIRPNAAPES